MCTEQEQYDRDGQEKFLCRCVLVSIIDLLPHIQIVVGSSIEFEGYAPNVVEHEVGASHVNDVGQCPRNLLCHTGDDITENLQDDDEDWVYRPGTCNVSVCARAPQLVFSDLLN